MSSVKRSLSVLGSLCVVAGLLSGPVPAAAVGPSVSISTTGCSGGAVFFCFQPSTFSVATGGTVSWFNTTIAPHTVTSDTGVWPPVNVGQNSLASLSFPNAGVYPYHCSIHPYMHGTVVVGLNLTAVLPALSNGAYGGYTTAAYVENWDNSSNVAIEYFDQNGNPVGSGDSIQTLPRYGTWTVRQDNGHSFATGGAGSALVYSDHGTLSAFVNESAPANGDGSSYTGIRPVGLSPGLYAPAIASGAYGGYTTGIGLLNVGTAATTIQIVYKDAAGHTVLTQSLPGIPPQGYVPVYSGNSGSATDANLPAGFVGNAVIISSNLQPLAAVVNEVGPGGQFSSYDAIAIGATKLYAPTALNNAYGGFFTGMAIQDMSGGGGSVSVNYYDQSGTLAKSVGPLTLAPSGYLAIYQGDATLGPPPSNSGYTAVITSTSQIAAIVNEVAPPTPGSSKRQSTSYNTFTGGNPVAALPLVESAGSDGWSTGEGIMNPTADTETVSVVYNDAATGAMVGTLQQKTLAPNAFWGLYQPTGGVPAGSRATAWVTGSGPHGAGAVAVVVNESNATSFMSYGGQ